MKLNDDKFDGNDNKKDPTPFDKPDAGKDDVELDAARRVEELFKNFGKQQVPKTNSDKPASTADIVEGWLERSGYRYQRLGQPGQTMFIMTFSDDDHGINIYTRVVCYKHLVSWFMSCPTKEHVTDEAKAKVMALVVSSLNYAVAGIDTVFDPSDGEWGVRICMAHVTSDQEFGDALVKLRQLYICVRNSWQRIVENGDTDWRPLAMASLTSFQMVTTFTDAGSGRARGGLLRLLRDLLDTEDGDESGSDSDDGSDGNDPEDGNGPDAADR